MRKLATLTALATAAIGCSTQFDRVRYVNAPPVTVVDDRAHVSEAPDERKVSKRLYHYDALFHERITRATELRPDRLARDINALGEVPDSTWFTNRINRRELTAADIRRGPNRGPGPMAHKPWTIVSSKTGAAPGFIFEDSEGSRYLLKFDEKHEAEAESGAHMVVHRLLWALGYNVPEDWLVSVRESELRLAGDAEISDAFGNERPMKEGDVDEILALAHRAKDGTMRALVSRFVPGEPLGGFPDDGVRDDDPNDTIAHEHRRSLRGLHPIFAWLKHTDVKETNTLDAYITDPTDPDRRYVRHYLIDFGKALGVFARYSRWRSDGFSRIVDFEDITGSLMSLGLFEREWDGLSSPALPGVGLYQAERYNPATFEVRQPWQPLLEADHLDKFWGAKLLIRLRPEHIRAAVAAAQYSSDRSARYLEQTILERQKKTARYWFLQVNPLDSFEFRDNDLCFDDLLRRYDLDKKSALEATRYGVRVHDYFGTELAYTPDMTAAPGGRICVRGLPRGERRDGYTIAALYTYRDGARYSPVLVHIATDPASDERRVIGVRRLD